MEYETVQSQLRPFWNRFFRFDWRFGLALLIVICIPRFFLVLNANSSGSYGAIGLIMLISAIAPFIFLNKSGRREIGIVSPSNYRWILIAFVSGVAVSFGLYYIGILLYNISYDNWYVYIGKSYMIPSTINEHDKLILFIVMALTGMIFSPIGEELFFRGIVHSSFAASIGHKKASLVDSAAFALVHISHFGLVFINNEWSFLFIPTLIWVAGMFFTSRFFFLSKKYSGSIVGAIAGHAGFNLGMIYCIFYML